MLIVNQKRFGFVFITEVPYETGEATEKLLEKIAFIRQTHYGGFYDFIPDLAMADTAYTNLALGAHTDHVDTASARSVTRMASPSLLWHRRTDPAGDRNGHSVLTIVESFCTRVERLIPPCSPSFFLLARDSLHPDHVPYREHDIPRR